MKKLLALTPVLLLSMISMAQFSMGIEFGSNKANYDLSQSLNLESGTMNLSNMRKEKGFTVGTFARIPISRKAFLQPEISFVRDKASFSADFNNMVGSQSMVIDKAEAALLLGTRILFIKLKGGAVVSKPLNLSASTDNPDLFSTDIRSDDQLGLGYTFGLGMDLGRLGFDINWRQDIENFGIITGIGEDEIELDRLQKALQMTVSWKLIKRKKKRNIAPPTPSPAPTPGAQI